MSEAMTPEEITSFLSSSFAAPLIISTLGWIIYGVNLSQYLTYLLSMSRKDHLFTKVLAAVVMIMSSASSIYTVYYDWIFSISIIKVLTTDLNKVSLLSGVQVALYSTVIMLVQCFWLVCLKRMMADRPKLALAFIIPVGFLSLSSFFIAVAVGALSNAEPGFNGSWPSPLISKLLRTLLGLDLGIDLSILLLILSQLALLKSSSAKTKRTISKLTWALCLSSLLAGLIMIAEIVVELPQVGFGHVSIAINISFGPMIPHVYAFGFLAVLNSRASLLAARKEVSSDTGYRGLLPGLNFTVDLPEENLSTDIPLQNARADQLKTVEEGLN